MNVSSESRKSRIIEEGLIAKRVYHGKESNEHKPRLMATTVRRETIDRLLPHETLQPRDIAGFRTFTAAML